MDTEKTTATKKKKAEKGPIGSVKNPHVIDSMSLASLLVNNGMLILTGEPGTPSVHIVYEHDNKTLREKLDDIQEALAWDGNDLDA